MFKSEICISYFFSQVGIFQEKKKDDKNTDKFLRLIKIINT